MRYLIDGYNLFFKIEEEISPLEDKREAFIYLLSQTLGDLGLRAHVIFDSCETKRSSLISKQYFSHVEVSFSPRDRSADTYLIELLEWNAQETTLVTSDRDLLRSGARLGAKTLLVEEFLQMIRAKQSKKSRPSKPTITESQSEFERLRTIFEKRLEEDDR